MAFRYSPSYPSQSPPSRKKCAASVPGGGYHETQCSRPRVDGSEWCWQHDPERERAVAEKRERRQAAEWERNARFWARQQAGVAALTLAEAHAATWLHAEKCPAANNRRRALNRKCNCGLAELRRVVRELAKKAKQPRR